MKSPQIEKSVFVTDKHRYSDLMILKSNAGYYIGTLFADYDDGCIVPGSRDSEYFETSELAATALATNSWTQRWDL
jgi:hypothetical protein